MGAPVRKCVDLQGLIEWAKEFGFIFDSSGKTHFVFRRPNTMPVYVAKTPSCHRARLNNRRDLKRALKESEEQQLLREKRGSLSSRQIKSRPI